MTATSPNRGTALNVADHRLVTRVARLYYERGLTQAQIADFLGLSRMKVNRLISLAMKAGIVQIQIVGPDEPHGELQDRVQATFQLQDARVVSDPLPEQTLRSVLAAAAADWLAERLQDELVVGLGLGRTVALMLETFSVPRPVRCRFVTLEGVGTSPNAEFAAYDVTSRFADVAGGTAEIISAPTFISASAVRDALLAEPSVNASIRVARKAALMIQSVGTVTTDSLLVRHGILSEQDLKRLREAGAVGDALGHFFDANGDHIPWEQDDRHVGLTLEEVKACSTSAVVAGGDEKCFAIRAGIRGGFIHALITNAATAGTLLDLGP